jgi:hypothetical protein
MRYFLYNDDNMDEYLKKYEDNSEVLTEINIMSDTNMTRIRECADKVGDDYFNKELINIGLEHSKFNFNTFTYQDEDGKEFNLPRLSTGERIMFFICMAKILDFDFVGQGFITILSMRNRQSVWKYLKNCKQGTIIVSSISEIPDECKDIGGGYYGY